MELSKERKSKKNSLGMRPFTATLINLWYALIVKTKDQSGKKGLNQYKYETGPNLSKGNFGDFQRIEENKLFCENFEIKWSVKL